MLAIGKHFTVGTATILAQARKLKATFARNWGFHTVACNPGSPAGRHEVATGMRVLDLLAVVC
jgi:hypothetical protein